MNFLRSRLVIRTRLVIFHRFARLRMEAQLYSLRASATRFIGKHFAAPYASSLLPRSRARARCGVLASRWWCGSSPGPCSPTVFRCDLRLFVNKRMLLLCGPGFLSGHREKPYLSPVCIHASVPACDLRGLVLRVVPSTPRDFQVTVNMTSS